MSDVPEERGGSELDIKWGEPRDCHFPLFNFLKPLSLPYMGLLYGIMWLGKTKAGVLLPKIKIMDFRCDWSSTRLQIST